MNNSTTKSNRKLLAFAAKIFIFWSFAFSFIHATVYAQKKVEKLGRGVVAIRSSATSVFISWRLLGTEPADLAFNIYRGSTKLNATPLTGGTNYTDAVSSNEVYRVVPVSNGVEEGTYSSGTASVWSNTYKQVPLQIPAPGVTPTGEAYTYSANDGSIGDLDGDGEHEIVLKWDPSNAKDNSQGGYTGNVYLDAYKMDGTMMWRIDLGRNIRAGAHYTQFLVYDFDSDGKAEVVCKTADGTKDAAGVVIGDGTADFRNTSGYVLSGPEFLTVFNGQTGAAMATTNYLPARGTVTSWGDNYGNRVDRFIAAVAYLDGVNPSIVMGRGYYTRLVRVAWDWRNGQLTHRWTFDSNTPGNEAYAGQGNHQMTVGDVDGDGKDEICNGSSAIDDDGTGLYANGLGHGDALHMSDMDPDLPGQEVWQPHESPGEYKIYGSEFRNATTGSPLWGIPGNNMDVGRGLAADIDPRYKGYECWSSVGGLFTCKGVQIGTTKPTINFAIYWDGDLQRELLDAGYNTTTGVSTVRLEKWNYLTGTLSRLLTPSLPDNGSGQTNNTTKANPVLQADLFGDWREEFMLRSADNRFLNIYSTTIPSDTRIYTLLHDPQYRVAVAWQNSAYNQPPHPSFYIGEEMAAPPKQDIVMVEQLGTLPVKLLSFEALAQGKKALINWSATNEVNSRHYILERSKDGINFTSISTVNTKDNNEATNRYSIVDNSPYEGLNYYRLKHVEADDKFSYSQIEAIRFTALKKLLLYPNPVRTSVIVQLNTSNSDLTSTITSVDGKILHQQRGSLQQINISLNRFLPKLKPAYYNLKVQDEKEVYSIKLIRQ